MLICKISIVYMYAQPEILLYKTKGRMVIVSTCVEIKPQIQDYLHRCMCYIAKHVSLEYGLQFTTLLVAKQPDNLK